jgi:hypothetical protein
LSERAHVTFKSSFCAYDHGPVLDRSTPKQAGSIVEVSHRVDPGSKALRLPTTIQAPIKFELVINLKTAKVFELDVPLQQQRADELSD